MAQKDPDMREDKRANFDPAIDDPRDLGISSERGSHKPVRIARVHCSTCQCRLSDGLVGCIALDQDDPEGEESPRGRRVARLYPRACYGSPASDLRIRCPDCFATLTGETIIEEEQEDQPRTDNIIPFRAKKEVTT